MSNGLAARLLKFALGGDEALNGLVGGRSRETLSGSTGRALLAGKWWAPMVASVLDGLFGERHCAREAAKEQARRDAEAGL